MATTTVTKTLPRPQGGIYNQFDEVIDQATTSSFVIAIDIDSRAVRESVIIIHNVTGGDLDWEILGNARNFDTIVAPTGTNDDDKGWVVVASGSIATTIAPTVTAITNPYTKLIVQIKHGTTTTNTSVWHRGES